MGAVEIYLDRYVVDAFDEALSAGLCRFRCRRFERFAELAEDGLAVFGVERDMIADLERSAKQLFGERIFDEPLDRAAQRTRAERRIPAFFREQLACGFGRFERHVLVLELADDLRQFQLDDRLDLLHVELMENDDFVDAVEELR